MHSTSSLTYNIEQKHEISDFCKIFIARKMKNDSPRKLRKKRTIGLANNYLRWLAWLI